MTRTQAIDREIGTESASAAVPARIRTRKISSVAYATEDSASDEKTARPLTLVKRSCDSRAVGIGLPSRNWRNLEGIRYGPWPRYNIRCCQGISPHLTGDNVTPLLPLSEMGVWAGRIADRLGSVKRDFDDSVTPAPKSVALPIGLYDNIIALSDAHG